jgi:hypothetical protein
MRAMTRTTGLALLAGSTLLALAAGGVACVGSESTTTPSKDAGGPSVLPDSGGPPVMPGNDGSPVETSDAGEDAGDGATGCTTGALQCNGNTPQTCTGGAWVSQTACGGATPLCSNGVCGTYIVTGGVRSTAPTPAADAGSVHLVSGGFEVGARTCTAQGVCVTGGIVP